MDRSLLHNNFLPHKTKDILLFLLLVLLAAGTGAAAAMDMPILPISLIGGLAGILICVYCLRHPYRGMYLITTIAFFAFYPNRLLHINLPVSTSIEVLVVVLFIGTLAQKKGITEKGRLLKTPISAAYLTYTLFFVAEFFNPEMTSVEGWIFFMRRFLMFMLIYNIAYRLIDSADKVKQFFKYWIGMSVLVAVYGWYQQFFGMMPFEMESLMSNPLEYKLYMQGGLLRKFSFLSDPVSFGILMGSMACFVLVLAANSTDKRKRNILFVCMLLMLAAMSFSGTRTTNIMLPSAVVLYALMTISNRRTLLVVFLFVIGVAFVFFAPIDSPALHRIRSTLDQKEGSLDVRNQNRKYIQPYIHAHPIGGGISTSGVNGERFNPTHPLAGFPPDSGLLLAALEIGWIGYALTLLVFFLVMYQGIHYYFLMKDPKLKLYQIAIVVSLFTIIITQYSQVTIGQLPGSVFFYSCLALLTRLKQFDENKQKPLQTVPVQ